MPAGPTPSQRWGGLLKIGPTAKPRAGRANAAAAIPPAVWAVPVMNRRRVIVSPSKAPGIMRSAVYLDLFRACLSDTWIRTISRLDSARRRRLLGACAHRLDRIGRPREHEILG